MGMFYLFYTRTADIQALRLAVLFRRLLRLSSSLDCWRVANVTPIPQGQPSSSIANYRLNFLTPIVSKVFENLVSLRRGRFMEYRGRLPTSRQFAYSKGLGTCDALLCVAHTLYIALEMGQLGG